MKGNFKKIIDSDKPVLVDFHAEWCGPCKMQSPILKELASELKDQVRIIKIDVDKNNAIASQYQVRGVPTLILFKNGKVLWRHSGLTPKDQLMEVITKNK
ncbi:MAG: thioredoxin [Salibacteraceae bacterium]